MLAGEPGIGKTSLADRAAGAGRRARLHGAVGALLGGGRRARVLAVAGSDRRAGARAGRRDAAARAGRRRARCWREIVPELRARLPEMPAGAAPPVEEGRFRLWRAVSALVHEAAKAKPAFIVLDDLHAARSVVAVAAALSWPASCARCACCCSAATATSRRAWTPPPAICWRASAAKGRRCRCARLDRAAAARFVQERVGVGGVGRRGARLRSQPGQPAVPRGDAAPVERAGRRGDRRGRGPARRARRDPPAAGSRRRRDARAASTWRPSPAT